jgi:hypothetical protein
MDEWLPAQLTDTNTLDEMLETARRRAFRFRHVESTASGEARVDVEWDTHIAFEHPLTWTEAEARDAFLQLSARLARARCFMIIQSLRPEVVPTILPQLHEMAEYETRMWRVRAEVEGPDVRERWVSLPVTA